MLGRLPLFRAAKMRTFGSSELAVEKAFEHEHLDQEGGFIWRKIGLLCSEILEEPPRLRDWHSGGQQGLDLIGHLPGPGNHAERFFLGDFVLAHALLDLTVVVAADRRSPGLVARAGRAIEIVAP